MRQKDTSFWDEWEKNSPFGSGPQVWKTISESFEKLSKAWKSKSSRKKKEIAVVTCDPEVARFIGSYLGSFFRSKYFWNKRTRKLYIRSSLNSEQWLLVAELSSPFTVWEGLAKEVKKLRKESYERFAGWYKDGN